MNNNDDNSNNHENGYNACDDNSNISHAINSVDMDIADHSHVQTNEQPASIDFDDFSSVYDQSIQLQPSSYAQNENIHVPASISSMVERVSDVIENNFPCYIPILPSYFQAYFDELVVCRQFYQRSSRSWVMLDYDETTNSLSKYGRYIHVISTIDSQQLICRCQTYTCHFKCHHTCLVELFKSNYNIDTFSSTIDESKLSEDKTVFELTTNVEKGKRKSVYSVIGSFERHGLVHVGASDVVVCDGHRTKGCYHRNKVKKYLYPDDETSDDDQSDTDIADDNYNDTSIMQDDDENEVDGDFEIPEDRHDIISARVHSHNEIQVPIYFRNNAENEEKENQSYYNYKIQIPVPNHIFRSCYCVYFI